MTTRRTFLGTLAAAFAGSVLSRLAFAGPRVEALAEPETLHGYPIEWVDKLPGDVPSVMFSRSIELEIQCHGPPDTEGQKLDALFSRRLSEAVSRHIERQFKGLA